MPPPILRYALTSQLGNRSDNIWYLMTRTLWMGLWVLAAERRSDAR